MGKTVKKLYFPKEIFITLLHHDYLQFLLKFVDLQWQSLCCHEKDSLSRHFKRKLKVIKSYNIWTLEIYFLNTKILIWKILKSSLVTLSHFLMMSKGIFFMAIKDFPDRHLFWLQIIFISARLNQFWVSKKDIYICFASFIDNYERKIDSNNHNLEFFYPLKTI